MQMISRRLFLTGATLLVTGLRRSPAREFELSFLVIGDWGKGTADQRKVADQLEQVAARIHPKFIISTGDNFYPDGVDSVHDPQWRTKFEEVYDSPALMVPWYVTLGNHDHKGNITAQIDYSAQSTRWRLPERHYKHSELLADGSRADFFYLDTTSIIKNCERTQLGWLERQLAKSSAVWKIVVGHHPVYASGKHGDSQELVSLVKPLLDRFGVQVYLNGHDHHLEHIVVGKTHYLTSGAAAKPRSAALLEGTRFVMGERLGFMAVRLSPTAMHIEFIDDNGAVLYQNSIPANPPASGDITAYWRTREPPATASQLCPTSTSPKRRQVVRQKRAASYLHSFRAALSRLMSPYRSID